MTDAGQLLETGPLVKRRKVPSLNADCLELVFQYLDLVELFAIARTCKLWNSVAMYVLGTHHDLTGVNIHGHHELFWNDQLQCRITTDETFIQIIKRMDVKSLETFPFMKKVSDCAAQGIAKYCRNLTKLNAAENDMSDAALEIILTNCSCLQQLTISSNWGFTGKCFRQIPLPSSLKVLDFQDASCILEDVIEAVIRDCPNLETLDVCDLKPERRPLNTEGQLSSLKSLSMGSGAGSDWHNLGFDDHFDPFILTRTPSLERLYVHKYDLGSGLDNLAEYCPSLTLLCLEMCRGTLNELGHLLSCIKDLNLTEFKCRDFDFIGEGEELAHEVEFFVDCLASFKLLEVLDISTLHFIDNQDVVYLIMHLPNLKQFNISYCNTLDDELKTLLIENITELKERSQVLELDVTGIDEITFRSIPNSNIDIKCRS